jgi:hypothetical protein
MKKIGVSGRALFLPYADLLKLQSKIAGIFKRMAGMRIDKDNQS